MTPVKVLLTNWESTDNLGDFAIVLAQVGLLEAAGGAAVRVLGNQPGVRLPPELADRHCGDAPWPSPAAGGMARWTQALLCCAAVLVWPGVARVLPDAYRRAVRCVAAADVVMPKGGGYLIADGSARKVLFLARSLFPLLLARRLGVRRVLWGHSVGPARGRAGRLLLRRALADATVVVRDDASAVLCSDLGIPAQRAPDLALLTAPRDDCAAPPQVAEDHVERIGVTVKRVSGVRRIQRDYLDAVARAAGSICDLARRQGRTPELCLIPQVTGPTPGEDDRPVLQGLAGLLADERCVVYAQPGHVDDAVTLYSALDFLIATRMHSAILAACAGTPFCLYGYVGGKAHGLVEDLGLPEWVTADQPGTFAGAAERAYASRDEIRAQIARGLPGARERIRALRLPGADAVPGRDGPR